jgi:RNA polymerase sigma factor (sigma-70 family)
VSKPMSFAELIERVRAGDQDAARELVERYEPAIRRAVRFRLTDTRLGAVFDSMDICQSVLASFFVRAASGQYELGQPEQLTKLLVAMAQKKLAFQVRRQRAQRRDIRRTASVEDQNALPGKGQTPSRQVAARELLLEAHKRLSDSERQLVEWRNDGLEWDEIAGRLSGSPEALRKKLSRALDRVAEELGLDEAGHD